MDVSAITMLMWEEGEGEEGEEGGGGRTGHIAGREGSAGTILSAVMVTHSHGERTR